MRIYFAGPLFTQAERSWNATLAALLDDAGHSVFLPQSEIGQIEDLEAESIFRVDIEGVRSADAVVAVLDGADPDSGTSFECGLAYALGIPIVALRTDFRAGGDALPGQRIPTINLMLSQAASEVVHLPASSATARDVAPLLLEVLKTLGPPPSPIRRPEV